MKATELIKKLCTYIQEYGDCDIAVVSVDPAGHYVKTDLDAYVRVETHKDKIYFIIY